MVELKLYTKLYKSNKVLWNYVRNYVLNYIRIIELLF